MASSAQNAPDGGISRSGKFEGPVDLTGVTEATFALWVRWQSEDGVAMSWVREDGKYMSFGLEGGRFRLYNDSQSAVHPTTPVAGLGGWYSVVVVTDGTGEGLYINGVSAGTGAVGFEGNGAGTFRLGGGPSGGGALDGYVVSGGIWDRKLSRAEVKAFHNKGVNLRYAGLPGAGKQLDERLYCLKDALDPAAVINEAGEVQERYGFTAFGRSIFMAPDYSARSSSAFDWDVLFHVELTDPETGWQLYGYRFYIPELGRWPNRDPIGERGGVNLYGFVGNEVTNRKDYLELRPCKEAGGIETTAPAIRQMRFEHMTAAGVWGSKRASKLTRRDITKPRIQAWLTLSGQALTKFDDLTPEDQESFRVRASREYCGAICVFCGETAGSRIAITPPCPGPWPTPGDTQGCSLFAEGGKDPCELEYGDDWIIVGIYHSHPDGSHFSIADIELIKTIARKNIILMEIYKGNPSGSVDRLSAIPNGGSYPDDIELSPPIHKDSLSHGERVAE